MTSILSFLQSQDTHAPLQTCTMSSNNTKLDVIVTYYHSNQHSGVTTRSNTHIHTLYGHNNPARSYFWKHY